MSEHYTVKEIFLTLQGEGMHAGHRAVFVRFAGCNLWNGRPEDRHKGKGACAKWCDTSFVGGEKHTVESLVAAMEAAWGPVALADRFCVLTGGEPALQFDERLGKALHPNWVVAVETNGSVRNDDLIAYADHICLSPKKGGDIVLDYYRHAKELKVVLPGCVDYGDPWTDEQLSLMASLINTDAQLFVQPQDPLMSPATEDTVLHSLRRDRYELSDMSVVHKASDYDRNLKRCVDFVLLGGARWKLCTQQHKTIGLR